MLRLAVSARSEDQGPDPSSTSWHSCFGCEHGWSCRTQVGDLHSYWMDACDKRGKVLTCRHVLDC